MSMSENWYETINIRLNATELRLRLYINWLDLNLHFMLNEIGNETYEAELYENDPGIHSEWICPNEIEAELSRVKSQKET